MTAENFKWYTLQTKPLYENKVVEGLLKKIHDEGLALEIDEVFSPEQIEIIYKEGVKKESKKKLFPSYIFVKMVYSEKIWHTIKKINGVVKFIGDNKPSSISEKEVLTIKQKLIAEVPKPKVSYVPEQRIFIKEGPFKDFYGTVKEVNYDKQKVTVAVTIFGRETNTEMDLKDITQSE